MMCEADAPCCCIVDCAGLHEIATTQSNSIKTICIDLLSKGIIGVPACVWHEFEELYEDEAATLAPFVKHKVRMQKNYRIGAAAIADKLNSGFSLSPYDEKTDWYAASICTIEGYTLLTIAQLMNQYQRMGCKIQEVSSLTESLVPCVKR
jgi:hypothetical protein